jgi:amino acid adenylation domain-containing protein
MIMRYLLSHAVSEWAERTPDNLAIRFSGQSLTYQELELKSNSLAHTLLENGLQRGDRVGIFMNKGVESAIAIYGILKAGGAYVPLDPFAPASRVAFVIRDCGIQQLISKDAKLGAVKDVLAEGTGLKILLGVSPDDELGLPTIQWEEIYRFPTNPLHLNLTEQDLAYILYTSGSTGVPKGIMHTHRSGLSFAEWAAATYNLTNQDRLSNHAPLHFDLSTLDFFAGAIAGACTVVIPEALTKFPANLARLIQDERITVWYSVPFALIQLMQRGNLAAHDLSSLRWILFAGEVFPTKHLRALMQMFPNVRFSNLYGPTETNVCTYYHVDELPEDTDETIPIGKACENIEDLVVDLDDKPVPVGEVGELLIRGGVVMKGYWGQAEKTASGFFRRPQFDYFEDVFYRTGDLVQLDEQGYYRYLGRKDRQIKTRGYRVELDEIEVALLSHAGVDEAAVYPIPDGNGSNLIEAAIIAKEGLNLEEADLVEHIGKRLPSYAIPVRIEILITIPRTSTGKINRRELQALAVARSESQP